MTPVQRWTEEEYLRREEAAKYKSEWVNGEIRQMVSGTADHAMLSVNVAAALRPNLRARGCRGYASQLKIWTPCKTYRYPDLSAVRGECQFRGAGRIAITNPVLIVEVLSESTEGIDRGEKLLEYQAMESVQSYLLVSQNAPRIEQYARAQNGHWDYQTIEGLENALTIPALNVTLTLSDVYDGVDFDGSN